MLYLRCGADARAGDVYLRHGQGDVQRGHVGNNHSERVRGSVHVHMRRDHWHLQNRIPGGRWADAGHLPGHLQKDATADADADAAADAAEKDAPEKAEDASTEEVDAESDAELRRR